MIARPPIATLALAAFALAVAPSARGLAQARTLGSPVAPAAAVSVLDPELTVGAPSPEARFPGVAARPLTVPAGMARIEQLVWSPISAFPVPSSGTPTSLAIGVLDDFELGVAWGVLDDPSLFATARWLRDPVIDLGIAARLTVPAMTEGDTLLRGSLPVAVRAARWLRIDTGVELELLFADEVSPLAQIPLTITFAPHELFFLGAMGSAGWLDGDDWIADVGGFVGWSARNAHGVIADGRIALQVFLPGERVVVSLGLRFFPRFWR